MNRFSRIPGKGDPMDDKCIWNCEVCGESAETKVDADIPECCDTPMVKAEEMPVCTTSTTAEHSRMDQIGEPCDDGRAGK
jgi:hypothetical protein